MKSFKCAQIYRNKVQNKHYFSASLREELQSIMFSHTNSVHRVNPVTYTLFKHTSSDGLSGLYDFPDELKNISKTEKYKWVTAIPAWSTLLLMSSQYCSRYKNLGQSRCGMFCDDMPCRFHLFLLGTQKPVIQQTFTCIAAVCAFPPFTYKRQDWAYLEKVA